MPKIKDTFTGLPHDVKSEDFDIDSAIGGVGFDSSVEDCLLFIVIIAHMSRHPKL